MIARRHSDRWLYQLLPGRRVRSFLDLNALIEWIATADELDLVSQGLELPH
jgi:hypothetical protein